LAFSETSSQLTPPSSKESCELSVPGCPGSHASSVKQGLDAAEVERNSPLLHLPGAAGELVVAYGTQELPELRRQSIDY